MKTRMEMAKERGTGRTTRQMQEAPHGSVFIWCNDSTNYPRQVAKELGREDLKIFRLDVLDDRNQLRGLLIPAIILDHAANPNVRQWRNLIDAMATVRPSLLGDRKHA